jgi:AcrR family transcriptional regulator
MGKIIETRRKIREQAIQLFNDKGYSRVSLREIAEAAGTSIGNLTYHFPQKENLIIAIQDELHTQFADEFFHEQNGEETLVHLFRSFKNAELNRKNNRFYYQNLYEFCSDSQMVSERNQIFRKKLYDYYIYCFVQFKKDGLMRPDLADDIYQTLAYTIVVLTTAWVQNHSPYYDQNLPEIELANALNGLLMPYMSEHGLEKLRELGLHVTLH